MNVLHPVGIVVFGDFVYWIDRESRNVMKIKKRGEIHGNAVQAAVDDLSDMIVVDARKSTGGDITLAQVVHRVDDAIQRIKYYPVDRVVCFVNTYPLDSHLSGG